MTRKSKKGKTISRRGIFPFLGSTLLLPFLGFGKPTPENKKNEDEEAYETLLRPDGTTVKVKTSTLKKSKVVQKNISNTTFLNWLGKKADSF